MTENNNSGRLPLGHVVFRVLLTCLVVALIIATVVVVVLHRSGELAVGRNVWGAVRHWALPW
jgi:hypothetical protein